MRLYFENPRLLESHHTGNLQVTVPAFEILNQTPEYIMFKDITWIIHIVLGGYRHNMLMFDLVNDIINDKNLIVYKWKEFCESN